MIIREKIDSLQERGDPVRLHLGCGKRYIPGFLHIDRDDYAHIDHRSGVMDLSFAADAECELIYACHVLEYFD